MEPLLSLSLRKGLFFNFVQKNKMNYNSIEEVELDTSLIYNFEEYIYSSNHDINMKGQTNYFKMKEKLWQLDSNSIQIQGALDILDSYFEDISFKQFEKEEDVLRHRLLVEFSDYYGGQEGRFKMSAKKDRDIQKALDMLHDSVVFENVLLPQ